MQPKGISRVSRYEKRLRNNLNCSRYIEGLGTNLTSSLLIRSYLRFLRLLSLIIPCSVTEQFSTLLFNYRWWAFVGRIFRWWLHREHCRPVEWRSIPRLSSSHWKLTAESILFRLSHWWSLSSSSPGIVKTLLTPAASFCWYPPALESYPLWRYDAQSSIDFQHYLPLSLESYAAFWPTPPDSST